MSESVVAVVVIGTCNNIDSGSSAVVISIIVIVVVVFVNVVIVIVIVIIFLKVSVGLVSSAMMSESKVADSFVTMIVFLEGLSI